MTAGARACRRPVAVGRQPDRLRQRSLAACLSETGRMDRLADKCSVASSMDFDGTLTMSRGLGRVERDVLEVFQNHAERTINSIEITALIVGRDTVTESEASSCRRALRSLARQGKIVDLGRTGCRFGRRYYALPDRAAKHQRTGYFGKPCPPPDPVLNAKDVDAAILKDVRGGFPWDDDIKASVYGVPGVPPRPGEVPYSWLTENMLKQFYPAHAANIRSAVSKALNRLVSQGVIQARGVRLGQNKHLTCRYVRLVGG
jgi:hypothetical protein